MAATSVAHGCPVSTASRSGGSDLVRIHNEASMSRGLFNDRRRAFYNSGSPDTNLPPPTFDTPTLFCESRLFRPGDQRLVPWQAAEDEQISVPANSGKVIEASGDGLL